MPEDELKPRTCKDLDYEQLSLCGEEGYLLSRIDGATSIKDLRRITGLSSQRVREILDKLEHQGAIEPFEKRAPEDSDTNPGAVIGQEKKGSFRRLYMQELSNLEADERVALAREAKDEMLLAFCFDPDPRVIQKLLDNDKAALTHARLVAEHHRTSTGLGHLGRKAAMIRDGQVQRMLFRNPQLSDVLFEKIMQPKRMGDAYRLALSREVTERVKSRARNVFRKKFGSGTSEEKVSLILSTEGRCLSMLIGVPLDARAAAILARRPIHSTLLVQNLARWPATPPVVLLHLAKQPVVRRTPSLRDLLRRHPNAPSQLKTGV